MTRLPRRCTVATLVLAVVVGAGVTWAVGRGEPDRPGADATATSTSVAADPTGARTALPGIVPARGEPGLPGLRTARPPRGGVARVAGPFDDRFALSRLSFADGRASGVLTVTSDVSDLLELQVVAGFYDADGRLLATRRFVHHGELHEVAVNAAPNETEAFPLRAPGPVRARAVPNGGGRTMSGGHDNP
jgi:hypothetical protein